MRKKVVNAFGGEESFDPLGRDERGLYQELDG
jgi:hypothetical protein